MEQLGEEERAKGGSSEFLPDAPIEIFKARRKIRGNEEGVASTMSRERENSKRDVLSLATRQRKESAIAADSQVMIFEISRLQIVHCNCTVLISTIRASSFFWISVGTITC